MPACTSFRHKFVVHGTRRHNKTAKACEVQWVLEVASTVMSYGTLISAFEAPSVFLFLHGS